jgi:hypothetical protein
MNFQFDALAACEALRQRHAAFLLDTFRVQQGPLWDRLWHNWTSAGDDPERMFAPLVLQGAWPFKPGATVSELQAPAGGRSTDRPLHPHTVQLLTAAGFTRPLYDHQVEAVRAAAAGNTVVLSAGTGSGKTEAFLIPLLDRLLWDHEEGRDNLDQPGIRAIIVYPLNALVNNQVDRVVKLLQGQSRINFAYYTSRLKDTFRDGKRIIEQRGKSFDPCQIIDRRTLRGLDGGGERPKGPPHILITNFSMLEYMLIRPTDRTIFRDEHVLYKDVPRLKAIVLDEAHVYAGAQAAEIHMLLRRTADRFRTKLASVQGFATSATLGDGSGDALRVFAAAMFEKPLVEVAPVVGAPWLPPLPDPGPTAVLASRTVDIPSALRTIELGEDGEPKSLVRDPAMCAVLRAALDQAGLLSSVQLPALASIEEPARLIFEVVRGVPRLVALRQWLFGEERAGRLKTLDEVASWLFGCSLVGDVERTAADRLLRLCSLGRPKVAAHPFLPVRMHAMLRTPAGVWVDPRPDGASTTTWPWGAVTSRIPDDVDARRLELHVCGRCGAGYLECFVSATAGEWADETALSNRPRHEHRRGWFPLLPLAESTDSDQPLVPLPEDWGGRSVSLVYAPDGRHPNRVDRCVHCRSASVDLIPITISPRAAVGSVVDAIYPHLGEHPGAGSQHRPGNGRRVLAFSDSRQGAAAMAAEVEYTHDRGVNRQILWRVLDRAGELTGDDYTDALFGEGTLDERSLAVEVGKVGDAARTDLAALSLFQEFGRPPARGVTLETIGLVEVRYPGLPALPDALRGKLSEDEWNSFLAILLDDARRRGATRPIQIETVSLRETIQRRRFGKVLVWSSTPADTPDSDDDREDSDTVAIVPHLRERSRIVRFATRLVEEVGLSGIDGVALLRLAWESLVALGKRRAPRKWLEHNSEHTATLGDGLQININRLSFRTHVSPPFFDPSTREVAFRSLRALPVDPDSAGRLRPLSEEERRHWRQRHAVQRVLDEAPIGLWSVEHTAQIDVDTLETDEQAFRVGARNLLSSSTTLEMGVDLGGLTFVLLTNAPPAPSNYWQRAGRAGRRADGSSLVLTLAPKKPHDQRVFSDLRAFLARPMRPPEVRLDGAPLLRRHVHAWLLTSFFDEVVIEARGGNPMDAFGDVEGLITPAEGRIRADLSTSLAVQRGETLLEIFGRWCAARREKCSAGLRRLLGGTTLATVSNGDLVAEAVDALVDSARPVGLDLAILEEQERAEHALGDGAKNATYLKALEHQKRSLLKEPLIGYLVRSGFLPRFGFPVDVVRLDTTWEVRPRGQEPERELRMERGIDLALSEYVPGSEVVADKHVHRVRGLLRNWLEKEPELAVRRIYFECRRCGFLEVSDAERNACSICAHPTQRAEDFRKQAEAVAKQRKKRAAVELALEDEPTPLRQFLEPAGFAVAWGERPRRVLDRADPDRMPAAKVTLGGAAPGEVEEVVPGAVSVGLSEEATLLIRSEGRVDPNQLLGYGYAICQLCGYSVPEEKWGDKLPATFVGHRHLRTGRKCSAGVRHWRYMTLGTAALADAFRVRLQGPLALPPETEEGLCLTLSIVLQQVAAEMLQVDGRSLEPMVATYGTGGGRFGREAVILDKAGSGVLHGLRDDPLTLLRRIVHYLERPDQASLVLFETQFYGEKLLPEGLRSHVLDPVRRALLLGREDPGSRNLGRVERRNPRAIALEWLHESGTLVLAGSFLADDAFGTEGLLRAVHARQLDGRGETRVLLARLPDAATDEAVLLANVALLVRAGIEVRTGELPGYPWGLLRRHGGGRFEALGAETEDNQPWRGPSLGAVWMKAGTLVRTDGEAGALFWDEYERNWNAAHRVTAEQIEPRPTEATRWVRVPDGRTEPSWSDLGALLAEKAGLGPLDALGPVQRLTYRDRYFATNAVSYLRIARLLRAFTPAPGARVEVTSGRARGTYARCARAKEILQSSEMPQDLAPTEADAMVDWMKAQAKSDGWSCVLTVSNAFLPHARCLNIEFAPGARWQRIEILLEHGLQGVRPVTGRGAWSERPLRTEEEHLVIRCVR